MGLIVLLSKTKSLIVAGGLTEFVGGVYFYTMKAIGGMDELEVAINNFEAQRSKQEAETALLQRPEWSILTLLHCSPLIFRFDVSIFSLVCSYDLDSC